MAMPARRTFWSVLAGALTLGLAAPTEDPVPSIPELVDKLHAPRKGIVSFEGVIDARQAEGHPRPHLCRIWRDGDRYRVDHLQPDASVRPSHHLLQHFVDALFIAAQLRQIARGMLREVKREPERSMRAIDDLPGSR